jgi:hypothetical protein
LATGRHLRSGSVAPHDIDGLLRTAAPANRHGLRAAARHIGSIGRHDGRRISMRPIPGDIIGIGVTDIVRRRWRSVDHGFAIRWIVVEAVDCRPERPTNSPMMPERMRDGRTGRRSKPCPRRGSRPRERFVRGKHDHCDTERRDKRPIHSIRHGTYHFVGCREPAPQRTLGRAFRACKRIINNWLRRRNGQHSVTPGRWP